MLPQRRSRLGAAFVIIGSLLAAVGEMVNARNMDVLSSSWYLSLGLIISGTFILLIGILPFALISERVNGLGIAGSILLLIGGLLLIIGTATLDWIILPFLISLGLALAAAINGPAAATQDTLNKIIDSLNGLGGAIFQKLFPNSTSHLSPVHIARVDGNVLVNNVLVGLHLPTIDRLTWWGHFSLSGGTLAIGTLLLGIALLRRTANSIIPGILLIVFTLLNLLCQFASMIPSFFGNITATILFLLLAWLGISEWLVYDQKSSSD